MSDPRDSSIEKTELTEETIGDLAPVLIEHPLGTYSLTPASAVCLRAISENRECFVGCGLDWGCGTGCLGIVVSKIPAVDRVVGLELSEEDVRAAERNVGLNDVRNKMTVIRADSFEAFSSAGKEEMDLLEAGVDFIVANPPASGGDDGFQLRRVVLAGARRYLKPGGRAYLQISIQYGRSRILDLAAAASFTYEAELASTPWVPFDQSRRDLNCQLEEYVTEEMRGGLDYTFGDPRNVGDTNINARTALNLYRETGISPLTKWQVHVFSYDVDGTRGC